MEISGTMSKGAIGVVSAIPLHEILSRVTRYFAELGFIYGDWSNLRRDNVGQGVSLLPELFLPVCEVTLVEKRAMPLIHVVPAQTCLIIL